MAVENINLKISFATLFLNKLTILLNNQMTINNNVINTNNVKIKVKIKVPRTNPNINIIIARRTNKILVKIFIEFHILVYIIGKNCF
jgi:hypothetical protein